MAKMRCEKCEKGVIDSKDEELIFREPWKKDIRHFSFSDIWCNACVETWSKTFSVKKEYAKELPFWSDQLEVFFNKMRRRVIDLDEDEITVLFKKEATRFEEYATVLLKKVMEDEENCVNTFKNMKSYLNNKIFGDELIVLDRQPLSGKAFYTASLSEINTPKVKRIK